MIYLLAPYPILYPSPFVYRLVGFAFRYKGLSLLLEFTDILVCYNVIDLYKI